MSTYEIVLGDGKQLSGLTMNGTMFVSQDEITKGDLSGEALSVVKITEHPEDGEDIERQIENAICDTVLHWEEGYLFNIREETAEERKYRVIQEAILEMSEIVYK